MLDSPASKICFCAFLWMPAQRAENKIFLVTSSYKKYKNTVETTFQKALIKNKHKSFQYPWIWSNGHSTDWRKEGLSSPLRLPLLQWEELGAGINLGGFFALTALKNTRRLNICKNRAVAGKKRGAKYPVVYYGNKGCLRRLKISGRKRGNTFR